MAAACQPVRTAAELAAEAQGLAAKGDLEPAIAKLEQAIQMDAGNPDFRIDIARLYIAAGRGDLAEVTIKQALARGAQPVDAIALRARALWLQERYFEILSIETPDALPATVQLELELMKARAMVATSRPSQTNVDITEAFMRLIAQSQQGPDTAIAKEAAREIERLRSEWPSVDRAVQHVRCASVESESFRWTPVGPAGGKVLRVGADRKLKTPADAARVAEDGDIVEIDPGVYRGGVALWPQSRLIVRGSGARPHISANGRAIQKRDVWLFTGNDVIVENVEISGARSVYENGAGIRHIGNGLTLRHVFLHDNENGVLTGNRQPDSRILIEYSEFANNGDGKGYAHNVYVGRSAQLVFRFNYSHSVNGGHLLKSRANENVIEYSRLTDEDDGSSNYIIDIAEGGVAKIIGNVIQQGLRTSNHTMISYAGEKRSVQNNAVSLINNTIYNREFGGILLRNHSAVEAVLVNNLLAGAEITSTLGPGTSANNLQHPQHGLKDWESLDFRLLAGALAIDAGTDTATMPVAEYVHPVGGRARRDIWRRDVGAYERCGL